MKNSKIKSLILLTFFAVFTSCSNDDIVFDPFFDVDDAAEVIAASMAVTTYGAVDNMNYVSDQIVGILDCGESRSETRSDSESANNVNITVSYTISETYALSCPNEEEQINYTFTADQTTTSNPLNTDHNIIADWAITGAEISSNTLTYNGNYTRSGEWIYNNQTNHIDTATASFSYENVKASKEDGVIFEGTSSFQLDGTSTVYDPYSYQGNIVFQEGNIAIVTFSTGEQYEINLNNGDVTPLQ